MPRKLRRPKPRRGGLEVSECVFVYLLWNNYTWARDVADEEDDDEGLARIYFDLVTDRDKRRYWEAIEPRALAEWTASYPGTRPELWWKYSAPELRALVGGAYQLIAGAGRCWPAGVPYVADWTNDPPLVESCPAFLDRLGLWLPGERKRVAQAAFAPQIFSLDLTVVAPTEPLDVSEGGSVV